MRVVVSVISHKHEQMIINLGMLKLLTSIDNVIVICRDNKPSLELKKYCDDNHIIYLKNDKPKGFAENNNLNFTHYWKNYAIDNDDVFLLLNPDVILSENAFKQFLESAKTLSNNILTANLFLDENFNKQDNNLRKYPVLSDFIFSYLLNRNRTYIDRSCNQLPLNEKFWSSGAFLAVTCKNYIKLCGLDESYYMYCEDIDFCRRALLLNIPVRMVMDSKIIHLRQRDSHKLFSPYFYWHISSIIRYLSKKYTLMPKKSSLFNISDSARVSK